MVAPIRLSTLATPVLGRLGQLPPIGAEAKAAPKLLRTLWDWDHATFEHSVRVSDMVAAIARTLELPEFLTKHMRQAALLHDVGKVYVPAPVLRCERPLEPHEVDAIQVHAVLGSSLLRRSSSLEPFSAAVRSHHEHWDGSGYPDGLQGTQIPLTARLIAVCDAFDVMLFGRQYAPSRPPERVVSRLWAAAGQHFDPSAVVALLETWLRGGFLEVQPLRGKALTLATSIVQDARQVIALS